jgi:hypothetical protein
MATVNFSNLQASSNATPNSQVLVRLDNSLSGAAGFSRVSVLNFEKSLNVYSTVNTNSGTWNYQGTDIKSLTGNWQNTYTNFSAQSANNLSVYTNVNTNSANWNYQGSDIKSLTGNWENTYSTVSSNSATWGLTIFSEVSSIISPNNTIPTFGLSARSSSTDVDFAIIPKGEGALLAQIPDGSVTNGDKRGTYATDWQRLRTSSSQVASGNYSTIGGGGSNSTSDDYTTIGGGEANIASGTHSVIGGGSYNIASGVQSIVGGGANNNASGQHATIGGGTGNTATVATATVGGGSNNNASGQNATIGGGSTNNASDVYATIGGGSSNIASGIYSTIAGGGTNIASGEYSIIGGGETNIASGIYSTIGGGETNIASGLYSTVAGGTCLSATANYSTVGGGNDNLASGIYSTVAGGNNNRATGSYSTVIGGDAAVASGSFSTSYGNRANSRLFGQYSHAAGSFVTVGDAQYVRFVLRNTTSGTAISSLSANLFLNGSSSLLTLQSGYAYSLNFKILGSQNNGVNISEFNKRAVLRNIAGTLSALNIVDITTPYEGNPATEAAITIDSGTSSVNVSVTGISSQTWRWVAVVDGIEMKYS